MMYFLHNNEYHDSHEYVAHLYQNFFKHFVWNAREKHWHTQQQDFSLKRMYFCNLTVNECYYLQILLISLLRLWFFEHTCTVNDMLHFTFQQVCTTHELIDDDQKWIHCFAKTVNICIDITLQSLFVIVLIHRTLLSSVDLWEQFHDNLCENLTYHIKWMNSRSIMLTDIIHQNWDYKLYLLAHMLTVYSKTLINFHLLTYHHKWNEITNNLMTLECHYNCDAKQH